MAKKIVILKGNVYSFVDEDGSFGVAKVLAVDPEVVHLKIYKDRYPKRPVSVDLKKLVVGSLFDEEGAFSAEHLPQTLDDFLEWKPELLAKSDVTPEELEGYDIWKDSGGGVF